MKKYLILITTLMLSVEAFAFSDTTNYEWKASIDYLKQEAIVQGYLDQTFKPYQTINRAEFIKIIIAAAYTTQELANHHTPCFDDIDPQAWYAPYVCLAKSEGIVQGYSDGTFGVAKTINQAEALKVILETYHTDIPETQGPWYAKYLAKAEQLGMGYFQKANPAPHHLRRGEMAYLMAWTLNPTPPDQISWAQKQTPSPTPNTGAYFPPRPHTTPLEIIQTQHPGPKVIGGYISNYDQWTPASYEPNLSNHTLTENQIQTLRTDLLEALNQERSADGAPLFILNPTLEKTAQEFAIHLTINGIYSHSDKQGHDPFQRAQKAGYPNFVTESMTWQNSHPLDSIAWWKASDLHWNNISNPQYSQAGIGIVKEPNGRYLVILMTGA